jgi:hypothetical protein
MGSHGGGQRTNTKIRDAHRLQRAVATLVKPKYFIRALAYHIHKLLVATGTTRKNGYKNA